MSDPEKERLLPSSQNGYSKSGHFVYDNVTTETKETFLSNSYKKHPGESGSREITLRIRFFVYLSHFLSAWGDRMWMFGVGLFMIELEPESLRLVAIYGFANGGAVLFFGALIGDWVDRKSRLFAAQLSLVVQNVAVAACSVLTYFVFDYHEWIKEYWTDQWLAILAYAVIIILAIISNLASEARKIAIERDWIVEICGKDEDLLSTMTAILRAIDLTTSILAPIATGQIMGYTEIMYGALFIAGWNVVSVVFEYYLMWKVYDIVPALKKQKGQVVVVPSEDKLSKETAIGKEEREEESSLVEDAHEKEKNGMVDVDMEKAEKVEVKEVQTSTCASQFFYSFITLYRGWTTFMRYDVAFAGIGLALLYMTVLGFDNITVGYAYAQGLKENTLGILMAAGGLFGIMGSTAYPFFRRRFGLERTGLMGFFMQNICLALCVASVFVPGSPFDPMYYINGKEFTIKLKCFNESAGANVSMPNNTVNFSSNYDADYQVFADGNSTHNATGSTISLSCEEEEKNYLSVVLLMSGIILARFGLWMADLTITQLFMQSVIETERGIVNGVQASLNQLMDMLKFLLVIFMPDIPVFGYLILLSYLFVCGGWVCYAKYSYSKRGHLFHFEKILKCYCQKTKQKTFSDRAKEDPENFTFAKK